MFTQLEAHHYKCLRQTDITLSPFNILIGPNASGKSSLLDILGFLRDALKNDAEQAIRHRGNTLAELIWQQHGVPLDSPDSGLEFAVEANVPKTIQLNGYQQVRYELAIGLGDTGEIVVQNENLWLISDKRENRHISQRSLFPMEMDDSNSIVHPRQKKTPVGYRVVVRKSFAGKDYFQSETTNWNIMYQLSPRRLALSGVPEDRERFPIALWFRSLLLDSIQILQLNSTLMRQPCPSDASRLFQADGSNLPIMVIELKEKHAQRFGWWLGHLQTILPDLQTIEIAERPEDRSKYLMVRYKNGFKVPSWLLSDGTLRLLALTLIAYLPPKERVFLVEEPENGIHPRAVEGVFQALSSVYEGQIFLATHSPLILALAQPKDLLIFAKLPSGATDVIRGIEHPALKNWQTNVPLDTLFAAGVLE